MTTTVPDALAFLDPWFACLHGLLSVAGPQRTDTDGALGFGRDPATDWRLALQWNQLLARLSCDKPTHEQLRQWREALLITGALASAAPFMELATNDLPARFQIEVFDMLRARLFGHQFTLRDFCVSTEYSDAFLGDFKRLAAVQRAPIRMPSMQVCAHFNHEPYTKRLEYAEILIRDMRDLELTLDQPGFTLESIELNASGMWVHSSALQVLRRIVELGVAIEHIQLPQLEGYGGNRMTPAWREEGIRFKITISASEIAHPDIAILCSALLHARGIRHVVIGEAYDDDEDGDTEPVPAGVWELIGLALMSVDSSTSVEAFTVRGIPISGNDADGLTDMVTVAYPLNVYAFEWIMPGEYPSEISRQPRRVVVPAGTELTSHYGFEEEEYTVTCDVDTQAHAFYEGTGVSHLFIAWRGFSHVPTNLLPSKRARVTRLKRSADFSTSTLLKSLEIASCRNDTGTRANLANFVDLASGETLRRLRLHVPLVEDNSVRAIFTTCPQLKHFSANGLSLDSMAAFEDAIHAGVCLSSLELTKLSVPVETLLSFLETNLSPSRTHDESSIQSLRLSPLDDLVLEKLDRLVATSPLRFLHYWISRPVQDCFERLAQEHHGKSTGVVREPFDVESSKAFLGCVHRIANEKHAVDLTDELKSTICSYAATPFMRVVICNDGDYEA